MIFDAGYRKDNLPNGLWTYQSTFEILRCSCRCAFVEIQGSLYQVFYIPYVDRLIMN